MPNWKTSIFGTGATVAMWISQMPMFADYKGIFEGIAAILGTLFALSAKDYNVTGGTTRQ